MDALALCCGNAEITEGEGVETHRIGERPGKAEVDPLLETLGDRRLVVCGTDADLAAVALRLLRTERLPEVAVGYVTSDRNSGVAELWGLPTDPATALRRALRGEVDKVPLVRDDVGGVLVGRGRIGPVRGVAYCDDTQVLRGQASSFEVTPHPGLGLEVTVVRRGLFGSRRAVTTGRAVQIGCLPTLVRKDGVAHERQLDKWIWYRHTEDLRLIRGLD
ncbi:hypothetical protein NLX83_08640 [Allokutzneria sp. A3M-2-11 16]|uniref:hypothetical protein n=1 Tax=Allokutzneria sp. A3M-2-11 16 TaxID=2962043 RepID=UPI0020B89A91|nr:hypothetical protein [Allokutzneria sp. A3M-2-11 16]MCP3799319.1 hypothetical protein [Allokutzneria sp. A3M-2-11 16]